MKTIKNARPSSSRGHQQPSMRNARGVAVAAINQSLARSKDSLLVAVS